MINPFEEIRERLSRIEGYLCNPKPNVVPNPEEDELLTIADASKLLSLAIPTLYSKVSRHELPVSRSHGKLYFSKKALIEWALSGRTKTINEIKEEGISKLQTTRKRVNNG